MIGKRFRSLPFIFANDNYTLRLRKFTFGNNGVESTHDALIKYQAMTFGFNITLFCIRSKPSFSSGQTPAYSSWLCF